MDLELVELSCPIGEELCWLPFAEVPHGEGFTDHWWHSPVDQERRVYRVYRDAFEVARVLVGDEVETTHYREVPDLGTTGLEIVFFEMHEEQRGSGVGRALAETLRPAPHRPATGRLREEGR